MLTVVRIENLFPQNRGLWILPPFFFFWKLASHSIWSNDFYVLRFRYATYIRYHTWAEVANHLFCDGCLDVPFWNKKICDWLAKHLNCFFHIVDARASQHKEGAKVADYQDCAQSSASICSLEICLFCLFALCVTW